VKIKTNGANQTIQKAYAKVHLKDNYEDTFVYLIKGEGAASMTRLKNLYDIASLQFIDKEVDLNEPLSARYRWISAARCREIIETNEDGLFALQKESAL
jgi:hypothetical protein